MTRGQRIEITTPDGVAEAYVAVPDSRDEPAPRIAAVGMFHGGGVVTDEAATERHFTELRELFDRALPV